MGSWQYVVLWAYVAHTALVRGESPVLPSTKYISLNPTQTTISLEKPYCSSSTAAMVYLYVVQNGATNTAVSDANIILNTTFTSSSGGKSQPYLADKFTNPQCVNFPDLSTLNVSTLVSGVLANYIVRVGGNVDCLTDPNFSGICNPPLQTGTSYRFKYVYANAGVKQFETDWSPAISTITAKTSSTIDTWPGRRSGGMIVLTSILSVLLFFLLLGFIGMVVASLTVGSSSGGDIKTYDTRISHKAPAVPQASADPVYSTTHEYSPHPEA
uniref:Uroplakin 3A n=1 Tax=Leptobrachium leishanense TaxID=445787 RepID=A0A8C5WAE8_9ANUR